MEEAQPVSRPMWVGIAAHCWFLEPEQFDKTFCVTDTDGRTTQGKALREYALRNGLVVLKEEDMLQAKGMADSIRSHPRVKRLMDTCIGVEQTAVWRIDDELCKARRDCVGDGWVADFKTTNDLDRFSPWVVTDMGYHRQGAWYTMPERYLEAKEVDTFFFFVVESSPPYESAVFHLAIESLKMGVEQEMANFEGFLKSRATGDWPRHILPLLTAEAMRKGEP